MNEPSKWPFAEWLDVSVRIFGLSPDKFWAMSLFDWLTLISQRSGRENMQPINRQIFAEMMMNFPDGQRPVSKE